MSLSTPAVMGAFTWIRYWWRGPEGSEEVGLVEKVAKECTEAGEDGCDEKEVNWDEAADEGAEVGRRRS